MITKCLLTVFSIFLTESLNDAGKLPRKPLISEVAAFNMNNLNSLEIGFSKNKISAIMDENKIIKAYVSKDWKDYLTGLEFISISNPAKTDLFVSQDGVKITILWYYALQDRKSPLVPIRLENDVLTSIGNE